MVRRIKTGRHRLFLHRLRIARPGAVRPAQPKKQSLIPQNKVRPASMAGPASAPGVRAKNKLYLAADAVTRLTFDHTATRLYFR